MQALARNGLTAAEVDAALHSSKREIHFRYDLLTSGNVFKRALTEVEAASIAVNTFAEIRRTARFSLQDLGTINFLTERIKPYCCVLMGAGGYSEFPLGVFLLSTPPKKADSAGNITREVEAYDLLQVLVDDKVATRYTVAAATNYITAVGTVLTGAGITDQALTATAKTLLVARDWPPGTKKLRIINDLLDAINYRALYFDEDGKAVAQPYLSPSTRASEYTYVDDDESVTFPQVVESLDLFGVPNKWLLSVSEPDRATLNSTVTNANATSPTSTVSRGRTIVEVRSDIDAPDQATLDAIAAKIAYEASQVYQEVEFETAIQPFHSDLDVLTLTFSTLSIDAKFVETGWSFDCRAGARHKHLIRRIVTIS